MTRERLKQLLRDEERHQAADGPVRKDMMSRALLVVLESGPPELVRAVEHILTEPAALK